MFIFWIVVEVWHATTLVNNGWRLASLWLQVFARRALIPSFHLTKGGVFRKIRDCDITMPFVYVHFLFNLLFLLSTFFLSDHYKRMACNILCIFNYFNIEIFCLLYVMCYADSLRALNKCCYYLFGRYFDRNSFSWSTNLKKKTFKPTL